MNNYNVAFQSKINFVDAKTFDKCKNGAYIDLRKMFSATSAGRADMVKSDSFYTDEVRTCTAGGLINTKTGEAVGFHYFDDLTNSTNVKKFLDSLFGMIKNPDRALIFGSKELKFSIYSLPIFKEIFDGISSKVDKVTVFREHTFPYSETDMYYSLKDDTWTLHSMFRLRTDIKDYDVTSPEMLNCAFKEIKVADGDEIYMNGEKVKIHNW